ncbi:MAG TPA: hypothetical protein VI564_00990 [Candidatus Nanoarchaeia archaeon]|nr:hypothetical protein [Candidatus Nanoarchaeia archaeon]
MTKSLSLLLAGLLGVHPISLPAAAYVPAESIVQQSEIYSGRNINPSKVEKIGIRLYDKSPLEYQFTDKGQVSGLLENIIKNSKVRLGDIDSPEELDGIGFIYLVQSGKTIEGDLLVDNMDNSSLYFSFDEATIYRIPQQQTEAVYAELEKQIDKEMSDKKIPMKVSDIQSLAVTFHEFLSRTDEPLPKNYVIKDKKKIINLLDRIAFDYSAPNNLLWGGPTIELDFQLNGKSVYGGIHGDVSGIVFNKGGIYFHLDESMKHFLELNSKR